MTQPSDETTETLEAARSHAAQLGPASTRHLERPEVQVRVMARVRHGAEVLDAVLGLVHEGASAGDSTLANEFLTFVLNGLLQGARPAISPQLRLMVDTQDLVQSVMADLWPELGEIEFSSRAAFVSLLAQRLRWKAIDRSRRSTRERRREDKRVHVDPAELDVEDGGEGPVAELHDAEEREVLEAVLESLSTRDRALLQQHLDGASVEDLMERFGLEKEAARKALQRAFARARVKGEKHVGRGPDAAPDE